MEWNSLSIGALFFEGVSDKKERSLTSFSYLLLKYIVLQYSLRFKWMACWVVVVNVGLGLSERENLNDLNIPPIGNQAHNLLCYGHSLSHYCNFHLIAYILQIIVIILLLTEWLTDNVQPKPK